MRLTAARGLVTSRNELTRPDGALVKADNVVIDYDNTIQQRKGYKEYSGLFSSAPKQSFTYKSRILSHYAETLSFDNGSGTFSDFSGNYSELLSGLRVKALEANGNLYFTTSNGIKKISVKNVSDLSTSTEIMSAGAAEANDLTAKSVPDAAGFLPAQSKVAYRILFGYKDANGNLHRGVPSSRTIVTNYSSDVESSEIFTLNVVGYATIADGDYILFDTIDSKYFIWFNVGGSAVEPITADTLDREGIEVNINAAGSDTVVAARIANALASAVQAISVEVAGTEVTVTVNEPGDCTNPSQGTVLSTEILVTNVFNGSITTGTPSKVELTFTLPTEVDETYFYQVYRTAVQTVGLSQTLADIDPGDEQYLVFEYPITSGDVAAGEIVVEDNTPEAFRQVGAYLYTNVTTGEGTGGITQANSRPPIAYDIASFRNSAFYANTKDYHTFTTSLLSVDNFVSGSTKLYIGRGEEVATYTFRGTQEITDFTVVARSATTNSSYIEFNAAGDEREYYIWFDTGAGTDPALTGKIGIRIPLELYPDTVQGSKDALIEALFTYTDFEAVDYSADVVRVTCTDAGEVTPPALSTPAPGWTAIPVTTGSGENTATNHVLLSLSSSVGTAIDLTARSLVRVINKDTDSPVVAQYLSGVDDLPGKILFKAKTIEDINFYIALSDSSLVSEFSPELSYNPLLSSVDTATNVLTSVAEHGFVVGDEIYIHDTSSGAPAEISGVYTVATVPSAYTFTLTGVDLTVPNVGALNGFIYKTTAGSDNNETPNRLYYSKINQPEAVPISNYIDVGSKDKQILRILALRDNLFVLKEDGIFIVTGASAPNFSVRLLDNSAILIAPDSAVVLNNLIYCLTTQGVVSISDSGVSIVSRDIEDSIKKVTTFAYNYRYISFGLGYESDRAYLLWLPTEKTDTVATQCYRLNTITNTWTRWTIAATCGVVNYLGDDRMYLGSGSGRNYILQERKNNERQDYADRDFTRSLGVDSVDGTTLSLSSVTDVEVGDVITQDQYITVPKFNRFLKKLDSDAGPEFDNYFESFEAAAGANLANSLLELVTQLNTDANLGTFTVPSGVNTAAALKTDYNTLITELNQPASGTFLKDYKEVNDLISYEVEILEIPKNTNDVIVDRETWFIQGSVTIYKSIKTEVEYAPQHFGEPEKFKQITEGTIIFDQGTISNACIGYASDRSLEFVDISFSLDGPGFWGGFEWSEIPWGGNSNERSQRTLIPPTKARCRYLHVRFKHSVARQQYKLLGISLEPREFSTRAYR